METNTRAGEQIRARQERGQLAAFYSCLITPDSTTEIGYATRAGN